MRIGIASGGFDPIHVGHCHLFQHAAGLCDRLIVGVNSDEWLTRKKGKPFMPLNDRLFIVGSLKWVYEAIAFPDDDGTANSLLKRVRMAYMGDDLFFMNGGDRVSGNTPEYEEAERLNIALRFGIGGHDKYSSSSALLAGWST